LKQGDPVWVERYYAFTGEGWKREIGIYLAEAHVPGEVLVFLPQMHAMQFIADFVVALSPTEHLAYMDEIEGLQAQARAYLKKPSARGKAKARKNSTSGVGQVGDPVYFFCYCNLRMQWVSELGILAKPCYFQALAGCQVVRFSDKRKSRYVVQNTWSDMIKLLEPMEQLAHAEDIERLRSMSGLRPKAQANPGLRAFQVGDYVWYAAQNRRPPFNTEPWLCRVTFVGYLGLHAEVIGHSVHVYDYREQFCLLSDFELLALAERLKE
jgi:hypothetical protein